VKQAVNGMAQNPKILIVESDTPVAMMMVNLLTQAGCDVLVANSGKKGMELAQEDKFDSIILAVDLPDINALEICCDLKQRHLSRNTPIVFISGGVGSEDRQRAFELGAVDYFEKPFNALEFTARILSHANAENDSNETLQKATT
jgi:DNA-binding response OmpR family regulator